MSGRNKNILNRNASHSQRQRSNLAVSLRPPPPAFSALGRLSCPVSSEQRRAKAAGVGHPHLKGRQPGPVALAPNRSQLPEVSWAGRKSAGLPSAPRWGVGLGAPNTQRVGLVSRGGRAWEGAPLVQGSAGTWAPATWLGPWVQAWPKGRLTPAPRQRHRRGVEKEAPMEMPGEAVGMGSPGKAPCGQAGVCGGGPGPPGPAPSALGGL